MSVIRAHPRNEAALCVKVLPSLPTDAATPRRASPSRVFSLCVTAFFLSVAAPVKCPPTRHQNRWQCALHALQRRRICTSSCQAGNSIENCVSVWRFRRLTTMRYLFCLHSMFEKTALMSFFFELLRPRTPNPPSVLLAEDDAHGRRTFLVIGARTVSWQTQAQTRRRARSISQNKTDSDTNARPKSVAQRRRKQRAENARTD